MNTKFLFFSFIFIGICAFTSVPFCSFSQNTYVKSNGSIHDDYGTSCKETFDKGTILLLQTNTNGMDIHAGLVKTDFNGIAQWKKLFQIGEWAVPQSVVQTPDSGYLVFGTATDSFALNVNNYFLFLLKTDSLGNEQWLKEYSLSTCDLATQLIKCKTGGYIGCSVADYNIGYPRTVLTHFDESGTIRWSNQYSLSYGLSPRGVAELNDGNICFTSCTGVLTSLPFNDVVISQTDSAGNLRWTKAFGTYYDDEPNAITINASDDIFITGRSYFMSREWDAFLLKLDRNGNKLLSKFYDAGTGNGEIMRCIQAKDDGSCTLLGDIGTFDERDITLMNIDATGSLLSVNRFPFSPNFTNYPYEMYTAYDSGFVFTGDVRLPTHPRDAILVKTDKYGITSCFNSTSTFTVWNDTVGEMNVILTSNPSSVTVINATSTLPLNALQQYGICENPLPIPDLSFVTDTTCPKICVSFYDQSLNQPTSWLWEFTGADSSSSILQNPSSICYHQPGNYVVRLTVTNGYGTSSTSRIIQLQYNCPQQPEQQEPLFIPNVFTPNGDSRNEEFVIKGLPSRFILTIFNRWGESVFSSSDQNINWKGKNKNNEAVTEGVYYYELILPEKKMTGFIQLIR